MVSAVFFFPSPFPSSSLILELLFGTCRTISLRSKDPYAISYVQFYIGEVSLLSKGGWAQNISLSAMVDQYHNTSSSSNSNSSSANEVNNLAKNVTENGAEVLVMTYDLNFDYQHQLYFASMADDGAQPVGWRAFGSDGRPQIVSDDDDDSYSNSHSKKKRRGGKKSSTGMKRVLGEESRRIFGKACQSSKLKAAMTDDGDGDGDDIPNGAAAITSESSENNGGNVTIGFSEQIGGQPDGPAGAGRPPVGAITGGVLGGFLGGLMVAFLVYFAKRRRARKTHAGLLSSHDEDEKPHSSFSASQQPSTFGASSSSSALARARAWTRQRRRGITWEDASQPQAEAHEEEAENMEAGTLLSPSDVGAQNAAFPPGSRPPVAGSRAGRTMLQLDTSPATLAARQQQQQQRQQHSSITADLLQMGLNTATSRDETPTTGAELSYFSPLQPLDMHSMMQHNGSDLPHHHHAWDAPPPPEYAASVRSSEVVLPSPAWPNQNTTLASLNRPSNGSSSNNTSSNSNGTSCTTPLSSGPRSSSTAFHSTQPTTVPPNTATDEKRRHVFPRTAGASSDSAEDLLSPFSPTLTERRPSTATVGTTRMVLDAIIVSSEGDQDESAFWAERDD